MNTNRLINEKSPYLLQHAHNPVNWYPWCEEAFNEAKKQDKPIFLSIGYSTCHWCHVMEKESFEDLEIAWILNNFFISIKVDREERPDIDNIYMKVCHILNGSGGWPLSIFMTPDKIPFMAGTYFPKDDGYGRVGFRTLLLAISDLWEKDRAKITEVSNNILNYLNKTQLKKSNSSEGIKEKIIHDAFDDIKGMYDKNHGGFGKRPKFPMPLILLFLHRYYHRYKDRYALEMSLETLKKMRMGGIYDHIGFGFHRYSTDSQWFLPHFEKMLYDNALLLLAYSEAYAITKDAFFQRVSEEIFEYLKREMLSSEGAFYSAQDADSEGKEGEFYVWGYNELKKLLTEGEFSFLKNISNILQDGNFLEEATGEKSGKNIIFFRKEPEELIKELGIGLQEFNEIFKSIREKLFLKRDKRIKPLRDEKVLTDWNALASVALMKSGVYLQREDFILLGKSCLDFLMDKMLKSNGMLFHRYKDGDFSIDGFIEDYAYLIWALLEGYFVTFTESYFKVASEIIDYVINNFWDGENHGFFQNSHRSETVLIKNKEIQDGVTPSGNSVMIYNLIRISRVSGDNNYESHAKKALQSFYYSIKNYPFSHLFSVIAIDLLLNGSCELFVIPENNAEKSRLMGEIRSLQADFFPNLHIAIYDNGINEGGNEFLLTNKRFRRLDGKNTFYLCKDFSCLEPSHDLSEVFMNLRG